MKMRYMQMVDMVSDALNVSWDITPKDYYHAAIMAANSAYPHVWKWLQ